MSTIAASPIFYFRDEQDRRSLRSWREGVQLSLGTLVFTNGVFDLIHAGHISYLQEARNLGDALIIGLNSDSSVHRLKGPKRPIQPEADRAALLAALRACDAVVVFDEDTPLEIISYVLPDALVKGGDYTPDSIVGRDVVEGHGGKVLPLPFIPGRSSTGIVETILARYSDDD